MKPDLTSRHPDLSRKIRALICYGLWAIVALLAPLSAPSQALEKDLLMRPETLANLPENQRVILDTRSSFRYLLGHIPGSQRIGHWSDFTHTVNEVSGILIEDKAWVAAQLGALGIERDKTIVLVGDPADPWRTDGRFFWMFLRFGFPRVALLDGGVEGWKAAGGDIERGSGGKAAASRLSAQDIVLDDSVLARQDWIRDRLAHADLKIIDNRTREEFKGETPYGSPRGGHIPGALSIPWQEFFTEEGRLKPPETLALLLKNQGIQPGQEIVVYCTGGVRSAMAFFVFRYLGYSVRNYDGSWWDWSRNPALPVENS